ncbi:hypothetical protein AURDEDRAFT_130634 [Auricularia subglabra TFB-10046 SS5]|uniref:Uncharacterized protein n=1 Tax=Auricularia subglabra (strain TFB-10046 / SS5) TaxID=717982 RepID=J0D8C7_AURST|nr:hypothetical protein AURDEDRAFT_130634 [Auricularia subglabra TFB-10046 SS5]
MIKYNEDVWNAAASSAKAREQLFTARVRVLHRDSEFWAPLVHINSPAAFVDRLYTAVLNLIRHTTLNEAWLQDAYTAKSVVAIIVDNTVGGLFAPLISKLEDMIDVAERAASE